MKRRCRDCGAWLAELPLRRPKLFCETCRAERKIASDAACSRAHYIRERKFNPEWKEQNRRRAKAWRELNAEHVKRYDSNRRGKYAVDGRTDP